MINELKKIETNPLDGFDFDEQYEDQEDAAGGIIVGTLVKFTNDAEWLGNGEELPADLELVAIDVVRVLQNWKDQKPVKEKTRLLAPDEPIPNVEAMNAAVDKSEWSEGPDGKLRGPYQLQRVLYLVDPRDMSRYTYPTSTIGGERAIRDLMDRTRLTRKYRRIHACAAVALSDTYMPNRFGGRQRPHFIIKRWVDMSGGQSLPEPAASTPKTPLLEVAAQTAPALEQRVVEEPKRTTTSESAASVEQQKPVAPQPAKTPKAPPTASAPEMRVVSEPSLAEQMDDQIPFKAGDADVSGRKAASASPAKKGTSNVRKTASVDALS